MTPIVHPSAKPEALRRAALAELRRGRLSASFLYKSDAQAEKWLAVHEAWSPARNDPNCQALYEWLASETGLRVTASKIHLTGLGCGGGLKDAAVASVFLDNEKSLHYWPVDISAELTLEAANNSPANLIQPTVIDLAHADDAGGFISDQIGDGCRVATLFGMLPNFNPDQLEALVRGLLRPSDFLLCNANLAPGDDYEDGVKQVLPQYDNRQTRDWLFGGLAEIGIEPGTGDLVFSVRLMESGLRQVVARFIFGKPAVLALHGEIVPFEIGSELEVFHSIRHQPADVHKWLASMGMKICAERISDSGEEGVFICRSH